MIGEPVPLAWRGPGLRPFSSIPEDAATILNVGFSAAGGEKLSLGGTETIKIGVSTKASATLTQDAADVTVDFKNELTNLPADADEFLGAVLGTNAKNYLNVLQKALELSNLEKLEGAIDGLARTFIEEFVGTGFVALASKTELQKFLKRVNKVVTSYETLEDRAVTLFDRHFDKLDELDVFQN